MKQKSRRPFWRRPSERSSRTTKNILFLTKFRRFLYDFFRFLITVNHIYSRCGLFFAIHGNFCTIWQKSLAAKIISVSKVIFLYFYKKCKNFLCVIFNHFICQKCTNLGAYFLHLEITIFSRFLRFRPNQGRKFAFNALLNPVFYILLNKFHIFTSGGFGVFPSSKIDQK